MVIKYAGMWGTCLFNAVLLVINPLFRFHRFTRRTWPDLFNGDLRWLAFADNEVHDHGSDECHDRSKDLATPAFVSPNGAPLCSTKSLSFFLYSWSFQVTDSFQKRTQIRALFDTHSIEGRSKASLYARLFTCKSSVRGLLKDGVIVHCL